MPIHGYVKNVNRQDHLYVYGADIPKLQNLIEKEPALGEPLDERLPYLKAEVVWAVREEMARTVEDVLARRTRALLLDARASMAMAPETARLMARELGHNKAWQKREVAAFTSLASGYLVDS